MYEHDLIKKSHDFIDIFARFVYNNYRKHNERS